MALLVTLLLAALAVTPAEAIIGRVRARRAERAEARAALRRAMAAMEEPRAALRAEYAVIDGLLDAGRTREALVAAERMKARTLLGAVTFGRREHLDPLRTLATLPRGAAVIEFVVGPESTAIFVFTGGRMHVRRVAVSRAEVARAATELRNAVAARRLDYQHFGDRMARLILDPIEPLVARSQRLYIVPDGALWQVPFAILTNERGEPLVARHEIAYLPSIAVAARPRARRGTPTLVAFGSGGRDLPEAEREVELIGRMYGDAAEVYAGSEATGERFLARAGGHSVVHAAAHAEVLDDWPLESSLLLSGRRVSAEEILRTPLQCDVAVLAACNTAAGQASSGEGLVGLSWAFLGAGCRSAVVSQWSVQSASTMRLMVGFHRHYIEGRRAPAALREAQLAMRRDAALAHPFYWAPFIVVASGW